MRLVIAATMLACLAACTHPPPEPPVEQAGVLTFKLSRAIQKFACDGRPIVIAADRTETTLTGACQSVRVTGNHNDLFVDLARAATIEITGSHNDVNWRPTTPPPLAIHLDDRGQGNSFNRVASAM